MKKLIIDMDYVMCINSMVNYVNICFDGNFTNETFPCYYIEDVFKNDERLYKFNEGIKGIDFYKDASILPNCKRVLKQLSRYYEMFICSKFFWSTNIEYSKTELKSKCDFLQKNFPFISGDNYIFTSSKNLVVGDIFIDDSLNTLKSNNSKVKLLFKSVYNLNVPNSELIKNNITKINDWLEVKNLLMKIK